MKIEVEIEVPEPPAKLRSNAGLVPIEDLPNGTLKAIALEWGQRLVDKAKERRGGK